MELEASDSYISLEQWLLVLIAAYRITPSLALIKSIDYYLERIKCHEDCYLLNQRHDYIKMQKYWRWIKQIG